MKLRLQLICLPICFLFVYFLLSVAGVIAPKKRFNFGDEQ